jgi:2-methylisocitrate lyase-like PEP mutase family enzyme
MVTSQQKLKAEKFLQYHRDKEILILLNSWDPGSSRVVEGCGYKAVATTSLGIAASLGYPDSQSIPFYEMRDAIRRIVEKVQVPVSADVEAGYGNNTGEVVARMKEIIETGVVGINLEDSQTNTNLVDVSIFCERVAAIRELSTSLGFHLVINARTDSFLIGAGPQENRLEESIARGNAYIDAGADCIFVPAVSETDKIATLVREIHGPVNILSNPTVGSGLPPTIEELESLGVARVSFGASVMKTSLSTLKKIADEVKLRGTYGALSSALDPLAETAAACRMATGG